MPYDPDTAIGGSLSRFPTTHHTLVAAASSGGHLEREALEALLAIYWKPVYKHIRLRWKRSNEEAKDLAQGFFAALIEQDLLQSFDPGKARLRTFLRACLDHFVLKHDEFANRHKRGGGIDFTSFDFEAAEREIAVSSDSPEDVFFREWRREVFAAAIDSLRMQCEIEGKHVQFRIFEQFDLAAETRPAYAELAAEHGISVSDVTNYLAWARRHLRQQVLKRVQGVTTSETESRAELRFLFGAL